MKKITTVFAGLLLVFLIPILLLPVSVYAEGINVISDNGDSVNMFNNVKINEPIKGNVISVFGDVEINAAVEGQVITVFGDAKISSEVSGQVVTVMGDTDLGAKAELKGNLISIGQVNKEPGASISGQEMNMAGKSMKLDFSGLIVARVLLVLMFTIIVFMVGMVYIAASGNKIKAVEENIESDLGRKLLLGFLAFSGATIVLALLFITILVPVLYLALIVYAAVISSIYLGKLIMKAMGSSNRIYMEFITGLLTITLVELLLTLVIPGDDAAISLLLLGILSLLINSFGVGTLFIAKFTKR